MPNHRKHRYTAIVADNRLVLKDPSGREVQHKIIGSTNNLTLVCHVRGAGFIGGWQCRSDPGVKFMTLATALPLLANSINGGVAYPTLEALPG